MAGTRSASGISKPRLFASISTEPEKKKRASAPRKKKTTSAASTKANTSKPRTKVSTGRVGKTTTTKKKTPTKAKLNPAARAKEVVEGVGEKVKGKVERKPGLKASGTQKIKGDKKPVAKGTKTKKV